MENLMKYTDHIGLLGEWNHGHVGPDIAYMGKTEIHTDFWQGNVFGKYKKFEVLMPVVMIWALTLCCLVSGYQCFKGT